MNNNRNMLPARQIWEEDYNDRFNDFHVALIIVILVIGFVLLACVTAAIWIAMAQRNKKARIPSGELGGTYAPYVGKPIYQSPVLPAGQEPFIESPTPKFYPPPMTSV